MRGLILLSFVCTVSTREYYVGAVVEFHPFNSDDFHTAAEVLAANIERYLAYMSDASELGTDIIVFPEYGVTGTKVSEEEDRSKARQFMVVGEVGRNYCDTINTNINDDILQRIGCAAVKYNMYVVVNIGEMVNCSQKILCNHDDGYNLYNTNLVFDRTGTLIAKYWKQNLFFEPVFDVPADPVFTSFQTDFGVSFGTFICFDSLWEQSTQLLEKYPNITDIVFPTAWMDEWPYFVATEVQNGWAVGNNVNFLASGYHSPEKYALGSGIYSPSGPLNFTYNTTGGSDLIVAQVPVLSRREGGGRGQRPAGHLENMTEDVGHSLENITEDIGHSLENMTEDVGHSLENIKEDVGHSLENMPKSSSKWSGDVGYNFENISDYSRAALVRGQLEIIRLCHGETFCCEASYFLLGDSQVSYYLLAYQGPRAMAIPELMLPIQMCGVVQLCCKGPDLCTVCPPGGDSGDRFDLLSLTSQDYSPDSLVLPSVLDTSGQLADWNKIAYDRTQSDEDNQGIRLDIIDTAVYSAAIYGRCMTSQC